MLKYFFIYLIILLTSMPGYASTESCVGPFLSFLSPGKNNDRWKLSALVVTPSFITDNDLQLYIDGTILQGETITQLQGKNFLRFSFCIPRKEYRQKITYSVGKKGEKHNFFVPAKNTDPHILFASCNEYKKSTPVWDMVMKNHKKHPYELAVFAGDQIYNDDVFELDDLKKIVACDIQKMKKEEPTRHLENTIQRFLIEHYLKHYSKPGFKEFLAAVAAKLLADDHDYFDGAGSYSEVPPLLETVTRHTEMLYLLFQHHVTKDTIRSARLIGPSHLGTHSWFLKFETIAFYGLDTRTERTPAQVTSQASRDFMFDKLSKAKQHHIFIIASKPVIYQDLSPLESLLRLFCQYSWPRNIYLKMVSSVPLWNRNLDLLTDFTDDWSHVTHIPERDDLITRSNDLVSLGKEVTFLGGDVHSAGAAEVVDPKTGEIKLRQITSSAISTEPAPSSLIGLKKLISYFQPAEIYPNGLTQRLISFVKGDDGKEETEIGRNNWLDLNVIDQQVYPTLFVAQPTTETEYQLEEWFPKGWNRLSNPQPRIAMNKSDLSYRQKLALAVTVGISVSCLLKYVLPSWFKA